MRRSGRSASIARPAVLGQADEVVLRWFILLVALLLDPAAELLLLAATAVSTCRKAVERAVSVGHRKQAPGRETYRRGPWPGFEAIQRSWFCAATRLRLQ
jgi:hypothetical protein